MATGTNYATCWGSGFGVNLSQAHSSLATNGTTSLSAGSGVTYALNAAPPPGLRITLFVGSGSTSYCAILTAQTGTIPFSSFQTQCWANTGTAPPAADLAQASRLEIGVYSGPSSNTQWGFCLTSLSL
jgi:hypothetical protein